MEIYALVVRPISRSFVTFHSKVVSINSCVYSMKMPHIHSVNKCELWNHGNTGNTCLPASWYSYHLSFTLRQTLLLTSSQVASFYHLFFHTGIACPTLADSHSAWTSTPRGRGPGWSHNRYRFQQHQGWYYGILRLFHFGGTFVVWFHPNTIGFFPFFVLFIAFALFSSASGFPLLVFPPSLFPLLELLL